MGDGMGDGGVDRASGQWRERERERERERGGGGGGRERPITKCRPLTFPPFVQLMTKIGNDDSNHFWERHYQGQRLPADVENEIREEFIRAKYVTRSWIPRDMVDDKEVFNDMLCENVTTDDLMKTIELIALGADVREGGKWRGGGEGKGEEGKGREGGRE